MAAGVTTTATSHEDFKVKVVIIDTHYVETDPQNFKSVVQRLTGKDCCVSWIEESKFPCRKTETKNVAGKIVAEGSYGTDTIGSGYGGSGGGGGGGGGFDNVSKGLSFNDLDRLILEAPPLDELNWLWDD